MTETPSDDTPAPALTPEQEEYLRQSAAAHAATAPSPADQAQASIGQMTERGPLLPAEQTMDTLMEQLRLQSEAIAAMQAQLSTVQKQQADAQAATGGPMVVRYAEGAADKLRALAVAHPDVPQGHFSGVIGAAESLVTSAKTLAGSGEQAAQSDISAGVNFIERFLTRTHWKSSGKFIDFGAIADDVATVAEEALKLAA